VVEPVGGGSGISDSKKQVSMTKKLAVMCPLV
jgi:hypothetical protein